MTNVEGTHHGEVSLHAYPDAALKSAEKVHEGKFPAMRSFDIYPGALPHTGHKDSSGETTLT